MKAVPPIILMAVAIMAGGCVSADVNPPAPKAGIGYVDFYVDDVSDLCWQIQRLGKDERKGKTVFEEFKPRTNGIVRLAFTPGKYCFAISFLNRAIPDPGVVNVIVENGQVTPVRVTLFETGKTIIESRDVRVGGTFYGRSGRSTRLRASEGATFRVETQTHEPVLYRPKEASGEK